MCRMTFMCWISTNSITLISLLTLQVASCFSRKNAPGIPGALSI